jgi:glycosyltransferase involved in cell wall biosynthesis
LKKILILNENFYPAFKGGGPIQSITNLIISLENEYNFCVVTSAYDLHSKDILPGIKPNTWEKVLLPQSKKTLMVWYGEKGKPGYSTFKKLIQEQKTDIVYMNGIFSYNLFLIPLLAIKSLTAKPKIIICPRGMLQEGALESKSFKKKTYLRLLKVFDLVNKATWHANNKEEEEDILKHFVENKGVGIAKNIPKKPLAEIILPQKKAGQLRLVYLSLLSSKKNLYFLLKLLSELEGDVSLDIYGPVKDKVYWDECRTLIAQMPDKVKYKGNILPIDVQDTFEKYDASILLTKGENFGHALYESLSVGRPIITSYFTPWNHLQKLQAGWNLDIDDPVACISILKEIIEMPPKQYHEFCVGAYELSKRYFNSLDVQKSYAGLFGAEIKSKII